MQEQYVNKSEREICCEDDNEKYAKEVEKVKEMNMYKNRKENKIKRKDTASADI